MFDDRADVKIIEDHLNFEIWQISVEFESQVKEFLWQCIPTLSTPQPP
jgi:hypothetical protein